jgi:hypothetical protein
MAKNNPFAHLLNLITARNFPPKKYFALIILLLFLLTSTSACVTLADPEASQQYAADTVGVLDAQTSVGQSFISRRPNFNGITLWLTSSPGQLNATNTLSTNTIEVKLYHSPGDISPIFTTTVLAPSSANNTLISINIPGLNDPAGQKYYLLLTADTGSYHINGRLEDAYPLGQAYINSSPINADAAFQLKYDYNPLALFQDLKLYLTNSWIIIPLLTLMWLPGWLLLELSALRTRFELGEQTAISIGLSLAIVPVVMLWTTVLKLKWSRQAVLFIAGFLIAVFIVRLVYLYISSRRNKPTSDDAGSIHESAERPTLSDLFSRPSYVLILIFLVSLIVRLVMVRDLATPAWVDAVHHALITHLILDNGAYPSTYLPYLNISPTVYHPGFHSIAASFVWLTNLDLPQSLLILGQVLNAFAVFSVYLITKTLTRSSTAGLFAAFIAGFLTPMPAYYTSWSRYTELTGLLLLPVVLALLQCWLDEKADKKSAWILGLGAITAAGLFMIHYRVIVFLACLLISYLIFRLVFGREQYDVKPSRVMLFVLVMVLISIVFVLPWFIPTLRSTVLPSLNAPVAGPTGPFQDFSWPYLTSAFGKQALVLAGLGLLWSLIKERSIAFIIILWVLMLFLLANLDVLKLPGSGLITNISVEIILFIPISILSGYFIDQLLKNWRDLIPNLFITPSYVLLFILFGFIAYLGSKQLVAILNPITLLSRQADLPAIEWLTDHIPENETIVINPFAWGYGLYAGNDGGYWIEPLSGRLTVPPPVLYGLGSGSREINQLSQEIISSCNNPSVLRDLLISYNLRYIFTGARGGVIPPEKLASSGLFDPLYHQDGVWILSIKPVNPK